MTIKTDQHINASRRNPIPNPASRDANSIPAARDALTHGGPGWHEAQRDKERNGEKVGRHLCHQEDTWSSHFSIRGEGLPVWKIPKIFPIKPLDKSLRRENQDSDAFHIRRAHSSRFDAKSK
jgi:hypothetical protein